jgi:DNA-binding transcriptional LysR family regulator
MQFQQVRYFLALYDERSFTRAAKRCGVTQPSLTNAIKNLECRLGGLLFDRTPGSEPRPTELATEIRPYLEKICENADRALQVAEERLEHVRPRAA